MEVTRVELKMKRENGIEWEDADFRPMAFPLH
ncbi:uncharacterized protein G2W53_027651 [Senna tora]|uniref:Uncharacterized protein n=1 Tax=Senna tora TaxID=362788 RepID=A0A834TJF0_9FABA|nr:uncharacterized protein G2W53_027651 [Senna tora]